MHKDRPELKMTEISVLAGKAWPNLPQVEMEKYSELHKKDKTRNENQEADLV
jgi:hypothetical protein